MRRDSIFYKLFQQSPTLLFELLTNSPLNAKAYRFDSVAVKSCKQSNFCGFSWCTCIRRCVLTTTVNYARRSHVY